MVGVGAGRMGGRGACGGGDVTRARAAGRRCSWRCTASCDGNGIATAQPRGPFTPGAGLQVASIAMLRVDGAGAERVPRCVERVPPGQGIGARLGSGVPIFKTAHKQVLQGGMQNVKGGRNGQRGIGHRPSAVGEMSRRNALLVRWRLVTPLKTAGKGMGTLHQQLENQHRQAKVVVLGCPVDAPASVPSCCTVYTRASPPAPSSAVVSMVIRCPLE